MRRGLGNRLGEGLEAVYQRWAVVSQLWGHSNPDPKAFPVVVQVVHQVPRLLSAGLRLLLRGCLQVVRLKDVVVGGGDPHGGRQRSGSLGRLKVPRTFYL